MNHLLLHTDLVTSTSDVRHLYRLPVSYSSRLSWVCVSSPLIHFFDRDRLSSFYNRFITTFDRSTGRQAEDGIEGVQVYPVRSGQTTPDRFAGRQTKDGIEDVQVYRSGRVRRPLTSL